MSSHDGKTAVSASADGTVQMWDTGTGTLLKTLDGHTSSVLSVHMSHDAKVVVAGAADGSIKIWNESSAALATLNGHEGHVNAVFLSRRIARMVSGGADGMVCVWSCVNMQGICFFTGHTSEVRAVCMNHDGSVVASGGDDKTVRIWNTEDDGDTLILDGQSASVTCVQLDDEHVISGGEDGRVVIWDLLKGQYIFSLSHHTLPVRALSLAGHGLLVSASDDRTVKICDLYLGQVLRVLQDEVGVSCVAASQNGRLLVSGNARGALNIWDLDGSTLNLRGAHQGLVTCLSCRRNRFASGSTDRTVLLAQIDGEEAPRVLKGHDGWVTSVSLGPKRLASGSLDKTVRLWNLNGRELLKIEHTDAVTCVVLDEDETSVASGSQDSFVRLWSVESGQLLCIFAGHTDSVTCLHLSGQRIVSGGSDKNVLVFGQASIDPLFTLTGHTGAITSVHMEGNRIVSGSADKTIRLWSAVGSGSALRVLQGHSDSVNSVAFMVGDTDRVLSAARDQSLRVWDLDTGQTLQVVEGVIPEASSMCQSSDGSVVVGVKDRVVRVLDVFNCPGPADVLEAWNESGMTPALENCLVRKSELLLEGVRVNGAMVNVTLQMVRDSIFRYGDSLGFNWLLRVLSQCPKVSE